MRSKVVASLAVAFSLGFVQAASAADLPTKAPVYKAATPAPVVSTWNGCYVGVAGGGAWGKSRHDNSAGPLTNDFNLSGALVGGTLGCNFQSSTWVYGIETDYSWTNKKGSATDIPPFNTNFVSETKEKSLGTVRGRIGTLVTPMDLLFATGGFAYGTAEINVTGPSSSASESKTRTGWTAGAGWEHKITPNLSAKLEYLYVDFGNTAYFNPKPTGFADRAGGVLLTDHIVRAGLNWKFW